jgi:signal transduction histidine kinase
MLSRTAGGLDARSHTLLQECIAQTKQCANSIRTASYLLHPPLLDEMGLVSAVQWQLDGFRLRSGIQVEARLPAGFVRLPPEDELSLFRVLQEALTNAHRHAGSTLIRVVLEQTPGAVTLTISDNGKGMRPAALASFREGGAGLGVGLAGMRERLRQLGGQVEIESGSNGTVLRASLPSSGRAPGATRPSGDVP